MKKRLRKKKHLGEFREDGFPVRFWLKDKLTEEEQDAFLTRWILEAIEGNKLLFGGALTDGFVTAEKGSVTDAQRSAVQQWLANEPLVLRHEVGALEDAWYGPASK